MGKIRKVAAIHDLSGYGRASLTIAIPVISAMGSMVCPLPTAVLSAQTFYSDYTMVDLTDQIDKFTTHWKKMDLSFDSIYSGFLASIEQIELVKNFVNTFKTKDCLVVVDPVMGDDGKQFGLFGDDFVAEMRSLVKTADMITPNYTEAGLLLGYKDGLDKGDLATAEKWRKELAAWGISQVVITSVPTDEDKLCTLAYDAVRDKFYHSYCTRFPVRYPGTGDTYTSVLVGAMLQGNDIGKAMQRATDFLSLCISDSFNNHPGEVEFALEEHLKQLM